MEITVTSVRECTVPSEPSVMVEEGYCSDQGVICWGVATEYGFQLLQSDALALEIALLP